MTTHNPTMLSKVEQYLAHRRSMGYKLRTESGWLRSFGRYADLHTPGEPLTVDLALRWATIPTGTQRVYHAKRLDVVRGLARYLAVLEPWTEIPPERLVGPSVMRVPPYIYTRREITILIHESLMYGCELWRDAHTGLRNATVIGLLACTGLRVGETLALTNIDVNLEQGLITVHQSKNLPMRLVPIAESTVRCLRRYRDARDQQFDRCGNTDAFICSSHGEHLPYDTLWRAFRLLCERTGLTGDPSRIPTLHDFRHTFACNHLLLAYKENCDINNAVHDLSVYLGHADLASTYWYLSSVPALLEQCIKRWKGPNFRRRKGA